MSTISFNTLILKEHRKVTKRLSRDYFHTARIEFTPKSDRMITFLSKIPTVVVADMDPVIPITVNSLRAIITGKEAMDSNNNINLAMGREVHITNRREVHITNRKEVDIVHSITNREETTVSNREEEVITIQVVTIDSMEMINRR